MPILQIVGLAAATSLFFALSVLAAEKKMKRQNCRQPTTVTARMF